MKDKKTRGGEDHDRLAKYAINKLKERGITNIFYEVDVAFPENIDRRSTTGTVRVDILGLDKGKRIGVECYLQVQPKLIEKRIPQMNLDELIFCVPNDREAVKLKTFKKEVWVVGFDRPRITVTLSDDVELKLRQLSLKQGNLSKNVEQALKLWFREVENNA